MKKLNCLFVFSLLVFASCGGNQAVENPAAPREIEATAIKENPVELFDKHWALVTVGVPGDLNTMTISWGSIGELWNRPVVTVYVSSSRYTHAFMEKNDHFTVSFFPPEKREALQYLGTHSGRDGDKIEASGLTLEFLESGLPSFKEADMVIEARKLYGAPFDESALAEEAAAFYGPDKMGVQTVYIGEIEHVWVRGRAGE
ncbi:MAG: flavin reductase family protein [Bacteroidales bacterium]|nr:flavin reductase family protein [Bacteroidales bacterium]